MHKCNYSLNFLFQNASIGFGITLTALLNFAAILSIKDADVMLCFQTFYRIIPPHSVIRLPSFVKKYYRYL